MQIRGAKPEPLSDVEENEESDLDSEESDGEGTADEESGDNTGDNASSRKGKTNYIHLKTPWMYLNIDWNDRALSCHWWVPRLNCSSSFGDLMHYRCVFRWRLKWSWEDCESLRRAWRWRGWWWRWRLKNIHFSRRTHRNKMNGREKQLKIEETMLNIRCTQKSASSLYKPFQRMATSSLEFPAKTRHYSSSTHFCSKQIFGG